MKLKQNSLKQVFLFQFHIVVRTVYSTYLMLNFFADVRGCQCTKDATSRGL